MPPVPDNFPHLPLILRYQGPARLHGGGGESARTQAAKQNRVGHSNTLRTSATTITTAWQTRVSLREHDHLPTLSAGIPILLEVDPGLDMDDLQKTFGFEIVAEHEDGFVIVASQDIHLATLLQKINDFPGQVSGSANVAKIHRLHEDPHLTTRLERLLSERLLAQWPNLQDEEDYVCDFGIACTGNIDFPKPLSRRKRESDESWAEREAQWHQERLQAYQAWDELMDERMAEVRNFTESYSGKILDTVNDEPTEVRLPDSFTVRINMKGKGLRDFVLNYQYLFEVVEPEEIDIPQRSREAIARDKEAIHLVPPEENAPAVCVIDSGIQQDHYLLEPAIDKETSRCFLPGIPITDVADYVRPGGHGTRVAGAVLYGEEVPKGGQVHLGWWLQNARVLNNDCGMPSSLFPPAALQAIVNHFHKGKRKTRLFNHSISGYDPCRVRHMSAWAAEIDYLSTEYDILFIQSVGNLSCTNPPPRIGIREHLVAGRLYPAFLNEDACRVANPAQSLQALTVGSVAYQAFEHPDWRSLAQGNGHPSGFTRTGCGIWGTIKPEVVEYGGDNLATQGNPPDISTPSLGRDCYPELVRSTMHPPGPAFDRDEVGTSYAAPKVTRIGAKLQAILPDESCLLYRALIVQSARWPQWALDAEPEQQSSIIRWIGYGIPNIGRATTNTDHRTTLIGSEKEIKAGECHIYQVPIPGPMRAPGYDYEILVEVTLSYTALPRRTRRHLRRYLATWVDWKANGLGESLDSFRKRAMSDEEKEKTKPKGIKWMIGARPGDGTIKGVKRSAGTIQKDWTVVKSNALPEHFCIAVVGHEGWSPDPDSTAKYAVAVSFEILGKEITIYDKLQVSVQALQTELEAEVEVEVEGNIDE